MGRKDVIVDAFPWTWRVTVVGFVTNFLVIGYIRCYGFLLIAYQQERDYPASILLLVYALSYALNGLIAPFMQKLCKRWTARRVVFLGGILLLVCFSVQELINNVVAFVILSGFGVGIGFSAVYATTIGLVGVCFRRFRTMAVGMCFVGASLGQVTMPVVTTFLLERYMLRGTLLMLGALMAHICIVALLLPERIVDEATGAVIHQQGKHAGNAASDGSLRNTTILRQLLPYLPIIILFNFGYSNQHPLFPSFAEENSLSTEVVTLLVSVQGICDLSSRVITSLLAGRLGDVGKIVAVGVAMLFQTSFLVLMLLNPVLPFHAAYVIVYGFSGGVYYVLWTVILGVFVQREGLPQAMALALMIADIAHLPLTYLMGFLRDNIDSFALLLWILCGVIASAGLLSLFCLSCVVYRSKRRREGVTAEKIPLLASSPSRRGEQ